jgi:hypothetical protein
MYQQLDEDLAKWQERLKLASNNILALSELDSFKRLQGEPPYPRLEFGTATENLVRPALLRMQSVWRGFGLLNDNIERAQICRGTGQRWMLHEKLVKEVDYLLNGASISLDENVPLSGAEQEGLLRPTETLLTASQMLRLLTTEFEEVEQVVTTVDYLWSHLPAQVSLAEEQLGSLSKHFPQLSAAEGESISSLEKRLKELKELITWDPVAVQIALQSEVKGDLDRLHDLADKLAGEQSQTKAELRRTRRALELLKATRNRVQAVHIKAQGKVSLVDGLAEPLAMSKIEDVGAWIDTLEKHLAQGREQSVTVGVQKCSAVLTKLLENERRSFAANKAPVERRQELKGLLTALKAKADKTIGTDGDTRRLLNEISSLAEELLYVQKTPLNQVEQLVDKYGELLRMAAPAANLMDSQAHD